MNNMLIKLQFNENVLPENYETDLNPKEYAEFLDSGRKINFLVADKDGAWHFSIVTFKNDQEGIRSIPKLFHKNELFGFESNHSKNKLHAMLTSLAGTLYHKLGNDLQPVVTYAIDLSLNFYTASKNIPNFNSADILIDNGFYIDENQLVYPVGCDFHLMSKLPESPAQYKNSYIFIKTNDTQELYYIKHDGEYEKAKIVDFKLFEEKINAIKNKDETQLHLSQEQIKEIVTSNGGHTPESTKYTLKGFGAANMLNHFLVNTDNNPGNWGVAIDPEKGIATVVQIDTECCWGPNFLKLNPDHVRHILEHPILGTYPLQLIGTAGEEEEIQYIESELAEVLQTELFPNEISKLQLQEFETKFMDEAVDTLFKIISTPNSAYRHMINVNLNQPIATAYKNNFYNTLIKNKNIYANEALKVKPYVEKARKITMEDLRWVNNIKLQILHNLFCLEICRHEITGYSPLTLFKLTNKIIKVEGVTIKESYHLTTIKAEKYDQLINALKANYHEVILKIILPKLELRVIAINKGLDQSANNYSSSVKSNFFLQGNNKRPRQSCEFESLWNEYDFFNKEKPLERPLEQAQLDNCNLDPFEASIECDTPSMQQ
ncbi:hypothetical protein [Legionella maioricensis]|uniref:Uncharacterized protein n=1 Tax=Legionella maioricensis TaxID=2896528 RepID=A0A9X2ICD4_9GAMM|nr:hypothetical protein [Legionella maioricensis]MCL9685325.1 hypothetical protein [Legionella maioricensis]MCL9688713.1 hypothetical protein [Legionella maioricensis]